MSKSGTYSGRRVVVALAIAVAVVAVPVLGFTVFAVLRPPAQSEPVDPTVWSPAPSAT